MTQPPSQTHQQHPTRPPFDKPGTPLNHDVRSGPSGWWFGLLALLPLACCGLPLLIAASVAAGSGAVLGGITGGVLILVGAVVLGIWGMRRRRRVTLPAGTTTGRSSTRDKCC